MEIQLKSNFTEIRLWGKRLWEDFYSTMIILANIAANLLHSNPVYLNRDIRCKYLSHRVMKRMYIFSTSMTAIMVSFPPAAVVASSPSAPMFTTVNSAPVYFFPAASSTSARSTLHCGQAWILLPRRGSVSACDTASLRVTLNLVVR